jgi:hypothetical protein
MLLEAIDIVVNYYTIGDVPATGATSKQIQILNVMVRLVLTAMRLVQDVTESVSIA